MPAARVGAPVHSELARETERFVQRGRIAALVLASGLALSFGSDRSAGVTAAVALLAVVVLAVEAVLRRARDRSSVVLVGWWSFALDAVVCGLALSTVDDPVDPIVMITMMVAVEAAVRWGARGAMGGGLLAGALGVAWAANGYAAVGRELPVTSIAFRTLAPVVIALPAGLLIERLRREREHTRRLFEHASEPIVLVSKGRVVAANPATARLVGEPPERLHGEPFDARFGPLFEIDDLQALVDQPATGRRDVRLTGPDGRPRSYAVGVEAAGESDVVFVVARDVTEERHREQQLRFRAMHDPLTGLPNRAALEARLADWLEDGRALGLVFLDLDGFKDVNDVHGHVAGDEVLVEIAARLRTVTRDADAVHRWAGDEFCLVVPGADEVGLTGLVRRIDDALARPIRIGTTTVAVGASMGAALAEPGDSAASLVHRADQQMYRRKHRSQDPPVPRTPDDVRT